ncbi:factor of DNA methylation 1-like isoform X2 [Magnolia sinica]|uniref:factor of DNA methylation 1-like isoform X2 n=1 Tax=Magnolia sinica TaxID=86752 RepID=UPI002657FEB2|nr:factor of DNA methylation 1-like isoform X2 [Magnolia sinica]
MDHSSGEDSEISDSEIDGYKIKLYDQLKTGKPKVKYSDVFFRCPFCMGKRKQDFHYKDLLQHATGVGASNRKAKEKASHLALSEYLRKDLADAAGPQIPNVAPEPPAKRSKLDNDDQFVWPWMGIVVNLPTEWNGKQYVGESANMVKSQLSKFHPVKVHPLWNIRGHTGNAIVDFKKDWSGFKDAMAFEICFEADHYGKKDWNDRKHRRSDIYGWVARADDYKSGCPIGDHLRKSGDLKTVSDIQKAEARKNVKLVENLANQIDVKNRHLKELECKYSETSLSLNRMIEERDKLHQTYNEEMRKMQEAAHMHSRRILEETEMLKLELESKRKKLEKRRRELDKRNSQNDIERRKLENEKKKNDMNNSSLQMATLEQKRADKNVLRLVEDQKREKEAALSKILYLEKQLDAKQALELEIEQMKGKLQVMRHMGDDDSNQKKVEEMSEELKEKEEEMEGLEQLNQALIVKERRSNDELQEARKELITGLSDMLSGRTLIGIKRMGELDGKPFFAACKKKFPVEEAGVKSMELCSLWEDHLKNPEWHPFKNIIVGEKVERVGAGNNKRG